MFSSFISGFICGGFVAVIATVYYCTDKPTRESPPIIERDVLAQQILDNLAKVQAFQRRIGNLPVPYLLAKQMVTSEEQLNICWIPVPAHDIEDMVDVELQEQKLEKMKAKFEIRDAQDLADDDQSSGE